MPERLYKKIAEIAAQLGYPPPGVAEQTLHEALAKMEPAGDDTGEVSELFNDRVTTRLRMLPVRVNKPGKADRIRIALPDIMRQWIIDYRAGRVDHDGVAACTITTDSQTLLAIAQGVFNPGVAIRQSLLAVSALDRVLPPEETIQYVDDLLLLIQA
jgi:hypothetical protein